MAEKIDPNQFIIARKRKKYRFALFANSPLCFELDEWKKRAVDAVEVGAGTGLFSVELAALCPGKTFVAVDIKGDRLQKGAREAEARGLSNLFFVRARADQLLDIAKENSVEKVWLTFPDPFPRKHSAGRRLTNKTFLSTYTKMLKPTGSLCLKHDNLDFFTWSLEQLVSAGFTVRELSIDLHDSDLSNEYKIKTSYELRWLDEGRITKFVRAEKGE